jgi:hypothetical protein
MLALSSDTNIAYKPEPLVRKGNGSVTKRA